MVAHKKDSPSDKAEEVLKRAFPEAKFTIENKGKLTLVILTIDPNPKNKYELTEKYRSAGWVKSNAPTFGHMMESLCIEAFRKFDIKF